ncbi:unnamed protein product [Calicophoron daubneyi]|uniref:C3H1-type domain-containing protein n=1 Tax=Calicophoron daubneyi TaxID=300641 RepID=A0AAV2TQ70_CALDB
MISPGGISNQHFAGWYSNPDCQAVLHNELRTMRNSHFRQPNTRGLINDTMPESLRAIVETAWASCTQGSSSEIVPVAQLLSSDHQNIDPELSSAHTYSLKCSQNRLTLNLPSVKKHTFIPSDLPPLSPDSGVESEADYCLVAGAILKNKDFECIPQAVDIPLRNYLQPRPKPRPLLRQKEIISLPSTPVNGDLLVPSSNGKPMQVHKRQSLPRRQDAIYNARYKTQPCLHYQKYKRCPLGENCHFAHGPEELLHPQEHPKYRTRVCKNFAQTGTCPFGRSCYFLHLFPLDGMLHAPNPQQDSQTFTQFIPSNCASRVSYCA